MTTRMTIATLFFLSAFIATWARAEDVLTIGVGRVAVVNTKKSIATVAVGDPTIADVAIEGDQSVMVFGKKPGETDLVLMGADQRPVLRSHVFVGTMSNSDVIVVRRPGAGGMTDEPWFCAPGCVKMGQK